MSCQPLWTLNFGLGLSGGVPMKSRRKRRQHELERREHQSDEPSVFLLGVLCASVVRPSQVP